MIKHRVKGKKNVYCFKLIRVYTAESVAPGGVMVCFIFVNLFLQLNISAKIREPNKIP